MSMDVSCGLPEHSPRGRMHRDRTELLKSLAVLFGCAQRVDAFADGARPDILRSDASKAVLFLGEAKDTETPGNTETQIRLLAYFRWIKAYLRRGGRRAIVAVCFGEAAHSKKWKDTLEFLSAETNLVPLQAGSERFDGKARIVWCLYATEKGER